MSLTLEKGKKTINQRFLKQQIPARSRGMSAHAARPDDTETKTMKDDNGLYYYPDPADHSSRVYVRQGAGGLEFRLWRADHPEVWERHGWLAYDVVLAAACMYKERGTGADPLVLYDLNVARALLKEEERNRG